MSKNVFIIETISTNKITEEKLKIEYEVSKIRHPIWNKKSFEEFVKWYKDIHKSDYTISSETFAYHQDKKGAREAVLSNQSDMNDGGAYEYAAIMEVPYGVGYAEFMYLKSFELYKFNRDKYVYEKINFDENEETKAIKNKYNLSEIIKRENKE